MNKSQVNTHAVEVTDYILSKLHNLGEHVVSSCSKTFVIKQMPCPDNDLSIRVYVTKKSNGAIEATLDCTDENDGPNDTYASIADTRLEFKVELLLNWKRIKSEFLKWIDETKKSEKDRLEKIEKYELELCAQVPTGFEV